MQNTQQFSKAKINIKTGIISEGIAIIKSGVFYIFPRSNNQMLVNEDSQDETLLENMFAF